MSDSSHLALEYALYHASSLPEDKENEGIPIRDNGTSEDRYITFKYR